MVRLILFLLGGDASTRAGGNGIGRFSKTRFLAETWFFTPDEIIAGKLPKSLVVIYDDDHHYMGEALVEPLAQNDCAVTFVTWLASGKADAATGRWVSPDDDMDKMLRHIEEIKKDELYIWSVCGLKNDTH